MTTRTAPKTDKRVREKLPLPAAVLDRLSDAQVAVLQQHFDEPPEFMDSSELHESGMAKKLFGVQAEFKSADAIHFATPERVATPTGTSRMPTLSAPQERRLFLRLNLARKTIGELIEKNAGKQMSAKNARLLTAWTAWEQETRERIVQLNMPLVLAMAKRTRLSGVDFNEMISEGNMALLRSVEKFDCSRGFKFSTYSCRAILKSFSRVAMRASRYRGYFPTEFDPAMERSDHQDHRRKDIEQDCVDELKEILIKNLAGLSDVERTVIQERFAIGKFVAEGQKGPKTLEQVGHIIGVTKERVRQIQNNALKKIREALEEGYLAA